MYIETIKLACLLEIVWLKIGDVTHKIGQCSSGVSIVESESESEVGGVTIELEIQWDGNQNITLDVKTKLGVGLSIQVRAQNIAYP